MRRPRAPARWGKIPRLAPAAPPLASAHRVVRALLLTAGTLSLVAVLALRARSMVSRRLGSKVGGLLPILSAAVIMGFGLFFLARGVAQVG